MISDILRVLNIFGAFGLLVLFAFRVTQQRNMRYRDHLMGTVSVTLGILSGSAVHIGDSSEKGLAAQIFVSIAIFYWYKATWRVTIDEFKVWYKKRRAGKRR